MKEFPKEEFEVFIDEVIPCALFHVMPTDIDKETGIRCDELILIQMLNACPEALRYKSLAWFVEHFILSMHLSDNTDKALVK